MKTISPTELKTRLEADPALELVDVRAPVEFRAQHAPTAVNLPLNSLNPPAWQAGRNGRSSSPVYLICQSGKRARQAGERFREAGIENVCLVEGGLESWEASGLPLTRGRRAISLERQVRIVAGALVLGGTLLGAFQHPAWLGLSGFVGAGLIFAGASDWCGMGLLLARMPWNR